MGDWYIDRDGRWQHDEDAPTPGVGPTRVLPHVAALETIHGDGGREVPRAGDIGDWIDPNAPDPTPDPVTDPGDPNFVHPWFGR